MLVMFNVPHGPWNDDFRFGQLTECWKEMRDHLAPELVPLFMACAPLMLDDVDHATKVALGSNWCKALWDDCLQEPPLQNKVYKVNQHRFFGGIKTAREDLKVYHKTQVVEEHAAIEGGMMPPRDIKMGPTIMKVKAQHGDSLNKSTDSSRVSPLDRALRSQCQNALVMAVVLRGDEQNNVLLRITVTMSEPTEKWHGEQSHKLRCSSNSPTWLAAQHHGAFSKHMQDTFALLAQCAVLEYCRFDITFEQQEYDAGMLIVQDEYADVMGQFAMINAFHRMTNIGG